MKFGVIFPQLEIGMNPDEIRRFVQLAETLDYEHLLTFDRVLAADPNLPDWDGPFDVRDVFHEALVLLGHVAGVTDRISLMTGILVLPQRQTALVAKQTTEIDVLSEGRCRLGIGVGWNELEFEALDQDFTNRGRRVEEQVTLLRRLWQNEVVDFEGEYHTIPASGLNPLPVQQPIPIWMGGRSDAALRRIARTGDGWITPRMPRSKVQKRLELLREFAREFDRDPDDITVLGRVNLGTEDPTGVDEQGKWLPAVREWHEMGASHVVIETMNAGMETATDHSGALRSFKEAVEDSTIDWET